jgi:hypothetical protein
MAYMVFVCFGSFFGSSCLLLALHWSAIWTCEDGVREGAGGGSQQMEQEVAATRRRAREEAGVGHQVAHEWGSRRWHRGGQAWEMWAGDVGWFCCSIGTRVSSKMGFGCYWADIGKQVGRLMHASRLKSTSRRQVAWLAPKVESVSPVSAAGPTGRLVIWLEIRDCQ